jgi:transposase
MPYPMQYRIAVARHYDESGSSIETAEVMGCSESWVRDLIKRRRETGSLDVLPSTRKYESKLDSDDLEQLARLIDDKPDLTLGELAEALSNKASVPTVWRATKKLGYSLKKRPSTPRNKTDPT